VWESYPVFQQYELNRFRAAFNKMKTDLGLHLRKKTDSPFLSDVAGDTKPHFGVSAESNCYSSKVNDAEVDDYKYNWMPIHTCFQWTDALLRERITLLILMPTGINSRHTLAVTGSGNNLEIRIEWPSMLYDVCDLHQPFHKLFETKKCKGGNVAVNAETQDYLARVQEFKKHIKELERKMDHRWEAKAEISLPKAVHAHQIESNAIGRKDDGTRILYINLLCECTDSNRQRGGDFLLT